MHSPTCSSKHDDGDVTPEECIKSQQISYTSLSKSTEDRESLQLHCGELQNTQEFVSPSQGATHCRLEDLERELKTLKPWTFLKPQEALGTRAHVSLQTATSSSPDHLLKSPVEESPQKITCVGCIAWNCTDKSSAKGECFKTNPLHWIQMGRFCRLPFHPLLTFQSQQKKEDLEPLLKEDFGILVEVRCWNPC